MDKNVEAQRIANKYLETEISNFQVKILSCNRVTAKDLEENLHIELDLLESFTEGESPDYSGIHHMLDSLLPPEYNLNIKHPAYGILIAKLFNIRIGAVQEMIKICNGPYSYNFKGENIDLEASLIKFFDKMPAIDTRLTPKTRKTQILVNELVDEIRSKYPDTNVTSLATEIAEMDRMKSSENPISYDTIRKSYLDDYK